jgi:beta-lactamase class D
MTQTAIIALGFLTFPAVATPVSTIQAALAERDAAVVLIQCTSGEITAFPAAKSEERLAPCSTFKIVNTLIGLETGLLTAPDKPFYQWDGIKRPIPEWNRDLTLRQAFQSSCVPAFQELARRIGAGRMKRWLTRIDYGDRDISAGIDVFWLPSEDRKTLLISAREQADFMRRLVTGKLPVAEKSVAILRDLMSLQSAVPGKLHAKTGSGTNSAGSFNLGWFVGFVDSDDDTLAFACFVRGQNVMSKDARTILESILSQSKTIP